MQMLNSPILSPSLNQADVHNVPPPWAVALANSIRSVDQKVYDVSKHLQKLERVEAKMADFEKELSNLRVEISQSRVKTEEMITVLNDRERERNVLFNDAVNTFYLRLYGVRHMVKDHSDSEKGNPLPPHRQLLSINSKGSFI